MFPVPKTDNNCNVFDSSAKSCGCTLDDGLHQGPAAVKHLVKCFKLGRFRIDEVGFLVDMKEMFRAFQTAVEERKALR